MKVVLDHGALAVHRVVILRLVELSPDVWLAGSKDIIPHALTTVAYSTVPLSMH